MYFPFKQLPSVKRPTLPAKNFTVLKCNAKGEIIKTLMVCLTKVEAEGVARAGNRFLLQKGLKDYFRVKEENYNDGAR